MISLRILAPVAALFVAGIALTSSPAAADLPYGPDTCADGYVWRDAAPNDHVCVTPGDRDAAAEQNALGLSRRSPTGGAYGPNTCASGFVWREAFGGDVVCVTPDERAAAR